MSEPRRQDRLVLGVDPGLSGALAFYAPASGEVEVFDMPTHVITQGQRRTQRSVLDDHQLAALIRDRAHRVKLAVVEEVSAGPKQGATSMFRFGEAYGAARLAVVAAGIPLELVRPSVWKRVMRVSADKDSSRRRASQLIPSASELWSRKKDDGRAEAALLALLGERMWRDFL